jgi:hypothetical protein
MAARYISQAKKSPTAIVPAIHVSPYWLSRPTPIAVTMSEMKTD